MILTIVLALVAFGLLMWVVALKDTVTQQQRTIQTYQDWKGPLPSGYPQRGRK